MADFIDVPHVPMQLTCGCLIASLQVELNEDVLLQFQQDLLERIRSTEARSVILDVSAVEVMDSEEFALLSKLVRMARLMGARTVLVGLQPGVVSILVELNVDCRDIEAVLNLEEALDRLSVARMTAADRLPLQPFAAEPGHATAGDLPGNCQ